MRWLTVIGVCTVCALTVVIARAQTPTPSVAPSAAIDEMDAAAATRAWLDSVPADKRAKSDAYFEGGYWLILWNFLLNAAILLLLLEIGVAARLGDFAERKTRSKSLQVVLFAVPFLLLQALLSFPLTVYEQFFREHA